MLRKNCNINLAYQNHSLYKYNFGDTILVPDSILSLIYGVDQDKAVPTSSTEALIDAWGKGVNYRTISGDHTSVIWQALCNL